MCDEQSGDELLNYIFNSKPKRERNAHKMEPKSRWLITGGAGFIGSHIAERLLKEGHFVRVLDNFSSGKEENLSFILNNTQTENRKPQTAPFDRIRGDIRNNTQTANRDPLTANRKPLTVNRDPQPANRSPQTAPFDLIRGDIRDKATCDKACEGIDYISHQAALRSVPKSMEIPHEFNAVNIDGSLNILEAALKNKVQRVVIASSSSVYGDAKTFPQKETDTPLLISPYALSKLAV